MKGKKQIIIVGASMDGHAGVVLDVLAEIGGYEVVGFVDNTPSLQNTNVNGIPVLGSTDNLDTLVIPSEYVHIAIGDNIARGRLFRLLKLRGLKIANIIHPTAIISRRAEISEGCFVGPRVAINNGVTIGSASIINTGAIVEHDNKIGFAVHLAPGSKTAGRVQIDDFVFVGVGATILPDIHIGSGVMIGAGSTVVKNVPSGTTIIGYAARKHSKNIYASVRPDVTPREEVYIAEPTLPEYPLLNTKFKEIVNNRMLSNFAKYSNQFELNIQELLSVKRALTFPNATSSLMLALKMLKLSGEVILPSFTFSATGHAVVWNGLTPVFADIDPRTFNLDPDDVERKITDKTSAIVAVHIFGNPCDISRLESIAKKYDLKLIFDSAHALGSRYAGEMVGCFGDVECFSLSGTKVLTSAEGGVATSNNETLMERMNLGRNYGAGNDYNCHYIGLNGKMSEFHAVLAIEGLLLLTDFIQARNKFAALYRERLSEIPGITFQYVPGEHVSTYKDFALIIDKEVFGMDRDELLESLQHEHIYCKRYFYPPLHEMTAYQAVNHKAESLENTVKVANNIICLPIYSHMNPDTIEKISFALFRMWKSVN